MLFPDSPWIPTTGHQDSVGPPEVREGQEDKQVAWGVVDRCDSAGWMGTTALLKEGVVAPFDSQDSLGMRVGWPGQFGELLWETLRFCAILN